MGTWEQHVEETLSPVPTTARPSNASTMSPSLRRVYDLYQANGDVGKSWGHDHCSFWRDGNDEWLQYVEFPANPGRLLQLRATNDSALFKMTFWCGGVVPDGELDGKKVPLRDVEVPWALIEKMNGLLL